MSVLGTVAAVASFFIPGGGTLATALMAYSAGSTIEGLINPPELMGPRLDDLRVQLSDYGAPIPFEYGTNRHAGTVMWPKELVMVEHERTESSKGGADVTSFSYTASVAVLVCEGPIAGIRRIWANKKLIYDVSEGVTGPTQDPAIGSLRIYLGTETQQPDPLITATDGDSPAYLGYAYVVFEDYDLTEAGNRLPSWEFEVITAVVTEAAEVTIDEYSVGEASGAVARDPITGYVWMTVPPNIVVYDPETKSIVTTINLPDADPLGDPAPMGIVYDASGQMIVGNGKPSFYPPIGWQINTTTYTAEMLNISVGAFVWPGIPSASGLFFGTNALGGGASYDTLRGQVGFSAPGYASGVMQSADLTTEVIVGVGPWLMWDIVRGFPEPGQDYGTALANHTITNLDWVYGANGHRLAFDDTRNIMYWSRAGGYEGIYAVNRETGEAYLAIPAVGGQGLFYDPDADLLYVLEYFGFNYLVKSYQPKAWPTAPVGGWNDYVGDPDDYDVVTSPWNESLFFNEVEEFTKTGDVGIVFGNWGQSFYLGNGQFTYASLSTIANLDFGSGALIPQPVLLKDIVTDICLRSELTTADIDVEQLTDVVDGYIVPRPMAGRAAIEPLQKAYFFDAVESDGKIKFVKRGGAVAVTIPAADRAAHEYASELPLNLGILRAQELELPVQLDVEYPDIDSDHLIGNQYDRRITKDTKHKQNLNLPVVMNAAKAKQVAIVNLYMAWQTQSFTFTTARKYAYLEPTDIIALPTDAATYVARLVTKREQPSGVIEWDAVIEALQIYTLTGSGAAPSNYVPQTIFDPGSTVLALMDIPLLRDSDDNSGFYVAMGGTNASWPGAALYKSTDDGSSYESVLTITNAAAIGTASTALPDFSGGNVFDELSTVSVVMNAGAQLTSATELQVLNGANGAVIGRDGRWEVIQFKTATLTAANTYRLSGLLRGRRGTEWATGTHQAGDVFVLISTAGWRRMDAADLGLSRLYKAPPSRVALSAVQPVEFTANAVGLKPYAPVLLGGGFNADGDAELTWTRRARTWSEWRDNVDVPLSELAEAYQVEIWNADFTTLKRTIATASSTATYTEAQQIEDFGAPQSAIYFRVFQISSTVGRGYAAQGTVPTTQTTFPN